MRTKLKIKKHSCVLQIDDVKLIAKNPSIQPFNPYIYNDEEDIMHFYYDLILKKKNYKGKWETITKIYVTEFGSIPYLSSFLSNILDFDIKEKGIIQHIEKRVNEYVLTSADDYMAFYPFQLGGLFNEDRFEVIKNFKTFKSIDGIKETESYELNIFIGGNELSQTPIGVHFDRLTKENMQTIIDFANSFMNMASEHTKNEIEKSLSDNSDDEYNYPKIVRNHLKEKYNIDEWRPIFLKLSTKEYVLEEFVDYILNNKKEKDLECCEWHNNKRTMPELFNTMKDYEAYLYIIDDNTD